MGINKTCAQILGVILLIIGVFGFVMGGDVFGLIVEGSIQWIYLIAGCILSWAGFTKKGPVKKANKFIGLIFIIIGIFSFLSPLLGLSSLLGVMMADNIFMIIIGLIAAYCGFKL